MREKCAFERWRRPMACVPLLADLVAGALVHGAAHSEYALIPADRIPF